MNILMKNVMDACVGSLAFYLFGYNSYPALDVPMIILPLKQRLSSLFS
jgi:ammonia channel protein AmtB